MRRLALFPLLSLSIVACAVPGPGEEEQNTEENVAQEEQPIVGGTIDTANDAVVFLASQQGGCTGTIIAKNGSTGYVLTAAHCVNLEYIVQDDNLDCLETDSCDNFWYVDEQFYHPDYEGNDYDFSILRFIGADASTPVIPAASAPDGIANGQMVEHSGYGLTEGGQPTNNRRHVTTPIKAFDSTLIQFDQGNGNGGGIGTCNGDSGGPGIRNGKVVGVVSFGDEFCNDEGYDGRVAAVYNDFIAPIIGGQVVETCDTCFEAEVNQPSGECYPQVEDCIANDECEALITCINGCGSSQSCANECYADNPGGQAGLNAIVDCYCTACADVCQDECGGSTTTTTTTTATTGAGGGTSEGGASASGGASNEGGALNEGGGAEERDGDGDESDGCGCATVGAERKHGTWFGLAGLVVAGAAATRRRRRR